MASHTIDLQDYRTPGAKVFTGRDRGASVREKSAINSLIEEQGSISLIIPDDIRSINPSFLEEFLQHVVTKLGEQGFYAKFNIVNNGQYQVKQDLAEAIDRILRVESALA